MTVELVGANPGVRLQAGVEDDTATAFASVWRVDWSTHGQGTALVLWHDGRTRVVTPTADLGRWLAQRFTRHFPEVRGLPWPEPEITVAPVRLELDLAQGVRAEAADVEVEITDPLDHRLMRVDDFDLGGEPHELSNVYVPCRTGVVRLAGAAVPGVPKLVTGERPASTAFLADAEVWCRARREP